MKLPRLALSAIGVAIVAASALGLSSSALAATPGVTHLTATDIAQASVGGLPGWTRFTGGYSSSVSGLSMPANSSLSYGLAMPLPASEIVDFVEATAFGSSLNDALYPSIRILDEDGVPFLSGPIFDYGNDGLTSTALWAADQAIGGLTAPFTLAALGDEFTNNADLADWTIQAFSFESSASVTLYTMSVNGERFSFLPEPVVTSAPTTVTQSAFGTTGLTFTTSGFLPGEEAEVYLSFAGNGGRVGLTASADSAGIISYTLVGFSDAEGAGTYAVTFVGLDSGVAQSFEFTVTAPAAPAAVVVPAALPDTGAEIFVPIIAAGGLLLAGATLAVVATTRRRSAAASN